MNAQYYYLDPDGQTVRGPFGLQDLWALQARGVVTAQSLVCPAGTENWQALDSFPELRPQPASAPAAASALRTVPAAARPKAAQQTNGCAIGCMAVIALFAIIGVAEQCSNSPLGSPGARTSAQTSSASSWDDGYNQGVPAGRGWGMGGHSIPPAVELHVLATRVCREKVSPPDEDQWVRGFESGFEVGFKDATKPAF